MARTTKRIIALGGGGFSYEPENQLLDEYVRDLTQKDHPTICFVTASFPYTQVHIERFHHTFKKIGCRTLHLQIGETRPDLVEAALSEADAVYIGGVNTANLVQYWQESGFHQHLWKAYDAGTVMAGVNAGSLCWFDAGLTRAFGGYDPLTCHGWLSGSSCIHYDVGSKRRSRYLSLVADGHMPPGVASDDGIALSFKNGKLQTVVSSRPDARAFTVLPTEEGGVSEDEITPVFLGEGRDVVIRRAGIDDAEGILKAFWRSVNEICSHHYTKEQLASWRRPTSPDQIMTLIQKHAFWSVVMDGEIQGFGNVILKGESDPTGIVQGIYLTPDTLGQGYGKKLLSGMQRYCIEHGKQYIELDATLNAVPFYKSQGYIPTDDIKGFDGVPCVPMRKKIRT